MNHVLVDMHRLRHNPFNGLYTFCYELGKSIAAIPEEELHFHYYLPKKEFGLFGKSVSYEHQRSIDKFFRFGTSKYNLWHVTTSLSWYRPFNSSTKNLFTLHDLSFLIEDKENVERNKRLLRQMQQRVDRADYIAGISRFALDFAKNHLHFGNKPTEVIYNGFKVNEFPNHHQPLYKPKGKFFFPLDWCSQGKTFTFYLLYWLATIMSS